LDGIEEGLYKKTRNWGVRPTKEMKANKAFRGYQPSKES